MDQRKGPRNVVEEPHSSDEPYIDSDLEEVGFYERRRSREDEEVVDQHFEEEQDIDTSIDIDGGDDGGDDDDDDDDDGDNDDDDDESFEPTSDAPSSPKKQSSDSGEGTSSPEISLSLDNLGDPPKPSTRAGRRRLFRGGIKHVEIPKNKDAGTQTAVRSPKTVVIISDTESESEEVGLLSQRPKQATRAQRMGSEERSSPSLSFTSTRDSLDSLLSIDRIDRKRKGKQKVRDPRTELENIPSTSGARSAPSTSGVRGAAATGYNEAKKRKEYVSRKGFNKGEIFWDQDVKAAWKRKKLEDALDESDPNDDECHVCGQEGNLICCESCPHSFHPCCVLLREIPEGEWFCPSCQIVQVLATREQDPRIEVDLDPDIEENLEQLRRKGWGTCKLCAADLIKPYGCPRAHSAKILKLKKKKDKLARKKLK